MKPESWPAVRRFELLQQRQLAERRQRAAFVQQPRFPELALEKHHIARAVAGRAVQRTAQGCEALGRTMDDLLRRVRTSHQQSRRVREIVREVVPRVEDEDRLLQRLAEAQR